MLIYEHYYSNYIHCFYTLHSICINIVKLEWRASLFPEVAIVPPIFLKKEED